MSHALFVWFHFSLRLGSPWLLWAWAYFDVLKAIEDHYKRSKFEQN